MEYLEIGQVVNIFGIKGMIKVKPFTENIKRFDKLTKIYIKKKNTEKEYGIEEVKYHKNMVLIKLKGIDTVEEAEKLRDGYLQVDRKDEEPLEEGTYYIVDMIGLEVYTDDGNILGKLEDIYNTGSNDIYVVKNEQGKQILLPAISEVIQKIDMENKKIIVHLIKGLI